MIISCPECHTRYNLTAAQIGPQGRNLKCAKCGHQWFVYPPEDDTDPDVPPPLPPQNAIGMDELAYVGQTPAWWRNFGKGLVIWLAVAVIALSAGLGATLWMLLQPEDGLEDMGAGPAPITEPQPTNLVLSNLSRDIREDGALVILHFSGTVTNTGETTQPIPELRLQLLDAKGIELDFWPAEMEQPVLEAGDSTNWTVRFLNPPLDRIAGWRAFFKTTSPEKPLVPATVSASTKASATAE